MLQGSTGRAAKRWIAQLARSLSEVEPQLKSSELADCALFLAYAGQGLGQSVLLERANALASRAVDEIGQLEVSGLYDGLIGVAWVIEHLIGGSRLPRASENDGWAWDDDPVGEVCDLVLLETLRSESSLSAEVAHGRAGHGIFVLERARNGRRNAHRMLGALVDRVEGDALESPEGLKWRRAEADDDEDDLGLAHGVAGVVAFLAEVVACGRRPRRAASLLEGGVRWLLAHRLETGGFPGRTGADASAPACRLAWCYGDLSVALALWKAGQSTSCDAWRSAAIEVACQAAARGDDSAGVRDACLCHGGAGLAHLFGVLHYYTEDERLRSASRRWWAWTLRALEDERAHPSRWSMLEGWAGVGLGLVAAVGSDPPAWGARMLIDPAVPLLPLIHDQTLGRAAFTVGSARRG